MIDPTLTVTIDRTSLALAPLVVTARLDGRTFGLTSYSPPPDADSRDTYAADSPYVNGSELIASVLAQVSLGFTWKRVGATTMAQVQAARVEMKTAIRQSSFTVTTKVADAPNEVWSATPGSQRLAGTQLEGHEIKHLVPVYAVSIPVYPIPGS